ncbi:uncharacterized protein LOC143279698 [Babylonia areolata]|uniref:uncharacterized protein LOC143279698 n=1 Tax=Babylonia areolata TaxID=304850 RepID=UPI003FD2B9AA
MDTTEVHHKLAAAQIIDKYTESIELSNACREFYKSRVEAAHCIKTKWEKQAHQTDRCTAANDNDRPSESQNSITTTSSNCDNNSTAHRRQRSSIDVAMDKLRAEMSSLMDQDLSLMKQLLTLNETIEDLKWQRRYYSTSRSSADLDDSECSISDTEMYESDEDLFLHPATTTATTTTSSDSSSTVVTSSSCRKHSVTGHKGERRCSESTVLVGESAVKVYHGEQDSFDSGIHESCSSEEEASLEASV